MKRRIVQLLTLLLVAPVLVVAPSRAQEANTKAAQASVDTWLSLVDKESYAASWETAATLFKNAVSRDQWEASVKAARGPLGSMKTRTLKSATPATTLPGAPDGHYVVFQFATTLERKSAAIETVTAIREDDGGWRVGGYFIK